MLFLSLCRGQTKFTSDRQVLQTCILPPKQRGTLSPFGFVFTRVRCHGVASNVTEGPSCAVWALGLVVRGKILVVPQGGKKLRLSINVRNPETHLDGPVCSANVSTFLHCGQGPSGVTFDPLACYLGRNRVTPKWEPCEWCVSSPGQTAGGSQPLACFFLFLWGGNTGHHAKNSHFDLTCDVWPHLFLCPAAPGGRTPSSGPFTSGFLPAGESATL